MSKRYLGLLAFALLIGCASSDEQESSAAAASQLSSPTSFVLSGTGTNLIGSTNYIFATSAGTVDVSTNSITATFSDPNLPLGLYNSYFGYSDQMNTGSCGALQPPLTSIVGGSGNQATTQISATGCTDQSTINILFDTSQIFDTYGNSGSGVVTMTATIDLAPIVSAAATGNSAVDGTGTTESTAGNFTLASDNSIVVTFSKALSATALSATLSGCGATLRNPSLVTGSNSTTVAWGLTGFSGFAAGTTCTLNVSGVQDAVANPEDPSDPNLNMTITFN